MTHTLAIDLTPTQIERIRHAILVAARVVADFIKTVLEYARRYIAAAWTALQAGLRLVGRHRRSNLRRPTPWLSHPRPNTARRRYHSRRRPTR